MSERRKKAPRRATPSYLKNAALHYLETRSSSRANLRRLLVRRVERSLQEHGGDREEQLGWVDALLDELVRLRLLDDAVYAAQRARSLARAGNGSRKIRAKLAEKGVPAPLVAAALAELTSPDAPSPDLVAACRFARSRRLGPYRREGEQPRDRELRQKELAKLGRAGFSYEIAIRVVDCENAEITDEIVSSAEF
ncbi:MAG: RecX family transcriptional regulator [Polyangiales bacterium]|nr:RecX family transcriptional regulator [Myxococcales bacterium]MCB9660071.1 RecX family transcriptional regulator [Sandaracinaceae bacterium]